MSIDSALRWVPAPGSMKMSLWGAAEAVTVAGERVDQGLDRATAAFDHRGELLAVGYGHRDAGDHDVGHRSQQPQHLLIRRVAETAGPPVDRRCAVGACDHVRAQPRCLRRVPISLDEVDGVDRVGKQSAKGHPHSQSAGEDCDRLGRQP